MVRFFLTCMYILLLINVIYRKPFQRSTSVKETIQEYQDSQEDMGVTGFISVNVDLKKVTATSENEDDLKKGMVLIPKEKDKKVWQWVWLMGVAIFFV